MRHFIVIITAALTPGCGTVQPVMGLSEEALVDGFPKPHPAQKRPGKDGKCRTPEGWPEPLAQNGGCWIPLDATPEQCAQHRREIGPYYVLYQGKCWYPLPGGREREPTSSSAAPRAPVTIQ